MPILYTGAVPKFVDISKKDWNIDPSKIQYYISKKTKAILPVHWNGHPADIEKICMIAKDHGLFVIEDAAAALGSKVKNRYVGTFGDIGCFSFQGAKVAIGGQGGAVVTNNFKLYERMKVLSSYGRTDSKKTYWSDSIGWNYGMPSLVAALVISQIDRLDHLINLKRRIFERYFIGLKSNNRVRLIQPISNNFFSNCCYPPLEILSNSKTNKIDILKNLNSSNIDARTIQPQISAMPMFKKNKKNLNSAHIENSGIILPSALNLSDTDIDFVCNMINDIT